MHASGIRHRVPKAVEEPTDSPRACCSLRRGDRNVLETEVQPVLDVGPVEPPGKRGRVVGVYESTGSGRRLEALPGARLEVEHGHAHAGDPVLAEEGAHGGVDGPEVLADEGGVVPPGLQAGKRQELLGRVAHVGAVASARPGRDPPEALKPEDMIDAEGAGMSQEVSEAPLHDGIAGVALSFGIEWAEAPVLPTGEETVGRGAHTGAVRRVHLRRSAGE